MKKIISLLLACALFLGLCACNSKDVLVNMGVLEKEVEPVILPDVPEQITLPTVSATDETRPGTEAVDSTGETYPWEAAFDETGYDLHEERFNMGRTVTWHKNFMPYRQVTYYDSGRIVDTYSYPSGLPSHSYTWEEDGSYYETRYLDNGYYETKEDGAITSHLGSVIFFKDIRPDGSWSESHYDENETPTYSICVETDGSRRETYYFENGNISKEISDIPTSGEHTETVYFEKGSVKYSKIQTQEYTQEEQYDEEGYRTYCYSKDANYEIELTADEAGKLVKVIENGIEMEDSATLTWYAQNYNFRQ